MKSFLAVVGGIAITGVLAAATFRVLERPQLPPALPGIGGGLRAADLPLNQHLHTHVSLPQVPGFGNIYESSPIVFPASAGLALSKVVGMNATRLDIRVDGLLYYSGPVPAVLEPALVVRPGQTLVLRSWDSSQLSLMGFQVLASDL